VADAYKGGEVVVRGLDELLRDLKRVGASSGSSTIVQHLTRGHRRAAKVVEAASRAKAEAQGGAIGKAKMGIKAAATQRTAKLVLDGARHPYIFGGEFGAKRFRQFEPWRGNQWAPDSANGVGYAVHPAVRETREEFVEAYAVEIEKVLEAIGRR
jgi:hypothetical protein